MILLCGKYITLLMYLWNGAACRSNPTPAPVRHSNWNMCPRERKNPGKLERKKIRGLITKYVSNWQCFHRKIYKRMHIYHKDAWKRRSTTLQSLGWGGEGQGCSKVTKGLGMTY